MSSSFFFLEVVEKSLITSESQIVFSKFFVNCLLMHYFEYCFESALKDVCGLLMHKPVGGPARAWNVFLAGQN